MVPYLSRQLRRRLDLLKRVAENNKNGRKYLPKEPKRLLKRFSRSVRDYSAQPAFLCTHLKSYGEVLRMKAVVLHEYGGPDKLKYEDVPDPVAADGEVLVRVAASSVNPIDYKIRSGAMKQHFPLELPAILGRDIAGIVRTVGTRVSGFAPGDKVMALGNQAYAELAVVKARMSRMCRRGSTWLRPRRCRW